MIAILLEVLEPAMERLLPLLQPLNFLTLGAGNVLVDFQVTVQINYLWKFEVIVHLFRTSLLVKRKPNQIQNQDLKEKVD